MENIKNKVITIGFCIIIISIFLINIFTKDAQISISERRKLKQVPEITFSKVIKGEVTGKWEGYVADQFVGRDLFRKIKAFYSLNIIQQKDNNKLYEKDGGIYKMEYPLNTANIEKSANRINNIYNKYLKNMNVYYSIIPDKSYYLENDNHLKMDFDELEKIMNNKLSELKYIDISESITIDDFYKTDLHWRQENLGEVVNKVKNGMNVQGSFNKNDKSNIQNNTQMSLEINGLQYEVKEVGDFYGTYFGQLGIDVEPDKMYVLTNDIIENCSTFNYETQETTGIYSKKTSADKYDIYLSGATPLITIENPNASTDKELLIFRDSFGSSLAPLLVDSYSKITLIDIRYMSSSLLEKYIEFDEQDVLFLYSGLVLNEGVLK